MRAAGILLCDGIGLPNPVERVGLLNTGRRRSTRLAEACTGRTFELRPVSLVEIVNMSVVTTPSLQKAVNYRGFTQLGVVSILAVV